MAGTAEVLALYRSILRKSNTFRFTDSVWYRTRLRQEFERHREETDPARRQTLFRRGVAFRDGREIL